ncbi:MAG: hypothetical protein ACREBR_03550, partial [bacterium]
TQPNIAIETREKVEDTKSKEEATEIIAITGTTKVINIKVEIEGELDQTDAEVVAAAEVEAAEEVEADEIEVEVIAKVKVKVHPITPPTSSAMPATNRDTTLHNALTSNVTVELQKQPAPQLRLSHPT